MCYRTFSCIAEVTILLFQSQCGNNGAALGLFDLTNIRCSHSGNVSLVQNQELLIVERTNNSFVRSYGLVLQYSSRILALEQAMQVF